MRQKQTILLIAMFATTIGVFLTPNVAWAKKHHHSSEDDGSISPSPSTTATPGSDSNPDCTPGVPSTTYCNAHDIGAGIREAAKGLGDGLTGK
jgi:hypothetical protein